MLDTPNAGLVLGKFIARAVADELVSPSFVSNRPILSDSNEIALAFGKARGLTLNPYGLHRLVNVWGASGALSSIGLLRGSVSLLLHEYLITTNREEAEQCIRDLSAEQFHHEVVFQVVELAIDGRDERDMLDLASLLKSATVCGLISQTQLAKGLQRILSSMDDIQLDNPHAPYRLDTFCWVSTAFHLLPKNFAAKAGALAKESMVSGTCPRPHHLRSMSSDTCSIRNLATLQTTSQQGMRSYRSTLRAAFFWELAGEAPNRL